MGGDLRLPILRPLSACIRMHHYRRKNNRKCGPGALFCRGGSEALGQGKRDCHRGRFAAKGQEPMAGQYPQHCRSVTRQACRYRTIQMACRTENFGDRKAPDGGSNPAEGLCLALSRHPVRGDARCLLAFYLQIVRRNRCGTVSVGAVCRPCRWSCAKSTPTCTMGGFCRFRMKTCSISSDRVAAMSTMQSGWQCWRARGILEPAL